MYFSADVAVARVLVSMLWHLHAHAIFRNHLGFQGGTQRTVVSCTGFNPLDVQKARQTITNISVATLTSVLSVSDSLATFFIIVQTFVSTFVPNSLAHVDDRCGRLH